MKIQISSYLYLYLQSSWTQTTTGWCTSRVRRIKRMPWKTNFSGQFTKIYFFHKKTCYLKSGSVLAVVWVYVLLCVVKNWSVKAEASFFQSVKKCLCVHGSSIEGFVRSSLDYSASTEAHYFSTSFFCPTTISIRNVWCSGWSGATSTRYVSCIADQHWTITCEYPYYNCMTWFFMHWDAWRPYLESF